MVIQKVSTLLLPSVYLIFKTHSHQKLSSLGPGHLLVNSKSLNFKSYLLPLKETWTLELEAVFILWMPQDALREELMVMR